MSDKTLIRTGFISQSIPQLDQKLIDQIEIESIKRNIELNITENLYVYKNITKY